VRESTLAALGADQAEEESAGDLVMFDEMIKEENTSYT